MKIDFFKYYRPNVTT